MANDPARPDTPSALEAIAEGVIARALAPYRDKFPPVVLEEFAEELRVFIGVFLFTHPVGSRMLSRVQPDDRAESGDQPSPGATRDVALAAAPRKGNVR
jgi:hypothetical protein